MVGTHKRWVTLEHKVIWPKLRSYYTLNVTKSMAYIINQSGGDIQQGD